MRFFLSGLLIFVLAASFLCGAEAPAAPSDEVKKLNTLLDSGKLKLVFPGAKFELAEPPPASAKEPDTTETIEVSSVREKIAQFIVDSWNDFRSNSGDLLHFLLGSAVALVVALLVFVGLRRFLAAPLELRGLPGGRLAETMAMPTGLFVLFIGMLMSFETFGEVESGGAVFFKLLLGLTIGSFVWGLLRLISVFAEHCKLRAAANSLNRLMAELVGKIIKYAIFIIAMLFIVQNVFGLNVNTLLASAGVAGLAIAFAAQNTLANFFGSLMIVADKPFTVGDRVIFNGMDGVVESVGFRSTRVRSLDGNLFTIPNSQVADAAVQNVTARPNIKYAFDLGLTYDTKPEKMREALALLHEILDAKPYFKSDLPPRIYFTAFKDCSLNISVVVWFASLNFFDVQQWKTDLNLEILSRFNDAGLNFAFPSNTTYLAGPAADAAAARWNKETGESK